MRRPNPALQPDLKREDWPRLQLHRKIVVVVVVVEVVVEVARVTIPWFVSKTF